MLWSAVLCCAVLAYAVIAIVSEPHTTPKKASVSLVVTGLHGEYTTNANHRYYVAGGTVRIRDELDKEVIVFNAARPAARAMIALGAFIMWFTWYGFNIGSLGGISGRSGVAAHAMLITTLSAMSGAVTSVVCAKFTSCFSFTISTTCNGAPRLCPFSSSQA